MIIPVMNPMTYDTAARTLLFPAEEAFSGAAFFAMKIIG
jgi:hypothetical protein